MEENKTTVITTKDNKKIVIVGSSNATISSILAEEAIKEKIENVDFLDSKDAVLLVDNLTKKELPVIEPPLFDGSDYFYFEDFDKSNKPKYSKKRKLNHRKW